MKKWIGWLRMSLRALALSAGLIVAASTNAVVFRVTTTGTGDGSTWPNACSLQYALANADGDTDDQVWIASGIYKPGTSTGETFQLVNGVSVLGGFDGDETLVSQRNPDPATNGTVLSGDINSGTDPGLDTGNSDHVVTCGSGVGPPDSISSNFGERANLDGVTITMGYLTNGNGAGLTISQSTPVIRGCTITNNLSQDGGGVYCAGSSSAAVLRNCKITGNQATRNGGGIHIDTRGAVKLLNCEVKENIAADDGGGMYYDDGDELLLANSQFVANEAQGTNSDGIGGALDIVGANAPTDIFNCRFTGNTAANLGGAINTSDQLRLVNCTVADNESGLLAGALFDGSTTPSTIKNCIFWNNTSPADQIGGSPEIYHSDIEGGWTGTGNNNIDDDPEFVGSGNYRLKCSSPCRDTGSNGYVVDDTEDVDEDGDDDEEIDLQLGPRIVSSIVDRGSYERGAEPCPGEVDGDCGVDVDDLLAVINSWGNPCPNNPCPADIVPHPCGNGIVNVDDLLAVLTNWGCGIPPGGCPVPNPITFEDAEDCMDFCSESFTPHGDKWTECVNACIEFLIE